MNTPEIIYGKHPIEEALKAEQRLEKILISLDSKEQDFEEIKKAAKKNNVPVQMVPVQKLNTICRKAHQGVIAYLSIINYYEIEDVLMKVYEEGRVPLFLVLDHITDVRNFGAIARTAYGAGVDAIIVPTKGGALISSDAMKTSAGALNNIHVCKINNLVDALDFFRQNGIFIVSADMNTQYFSYQTDYTVPVAIILGAEDEGVANTLIRKSDRIVKIPLLSSLESYNVSVSAGMILHEVMRQRAVA